MSEEKEVSWKGIKVYQETYDDIEAVRKRLLRDGTRGLPADVVAKLNSISYGNIVAAGIETLRLLMDGTLVEK